MLQFSTSAWAPLAAMAAMGSSTGFIAASLWRRHGVKAVVLSSGDDAHAYLANVFKLAILAGTAFCVAYALDPLVTAGLGPISWLAGPGAAAVGVALMVLGASLVAAAQLNMGLSWRVGIDHLHRTALVTEGLYRISRNLIYLGMFAVITGIFLMAPNAVTLTMMGVSLVAVPAQVRLEEQFLGHLHGADFAAYRMRTRRWL